MTSIAGVHGLERLIPPLQHTGGATRDAAIRRAFRPELKMIRTHFTNTLLSDPLSLDLQTWFANFFEAFRISHSFEEMFKIHIAQLHLLLKDPLGIPLRRNPMLYSNNRVYDQRSIELHQLSPDSTIRARIPLEPNNPAQFNAIGPHAHVSFLLDWMERLHLLEEQPEMDKLFHELRQQHALAPRPASQVSDVADRRMPRMVTFSDLRSRDEGENPLAPDQTVQGAPRPRIMELTTLRQRDAVAEMARRSAPEVVQPQASNPTQEPRLVFESVQDQAPEVIQERMPVSSQVLEPVPEPAPAHSPIHAQPAAPNLAARAERIARLRADVLRRQADEAAEKAKAEEEEAKQDAFAERLGKIVGEVRAEIIDEFAKIDGEAIAIRDEGLAELAQLGIIDQGQWVDLEQMRQGNQARINTLEDRNRLLDRNITQLENGISYVNAQNNETELLNIHLEKRVNKLEIDARKKQKSSWTSIFPVLGILGAGALTMFVLSAALISSGVAASASVTLNKGVWSTLSISA